MSEASPDQSPSTALSLPGQGVIRFFLQNAVAANLIMLILLVGGVIAGMGLNAQVFPTINPGIITVTVPYPGAAPSEVEESITRRVEEAVIGIEGVDEVTSRAAENVGTITIELKDFVDEAEIKNDVEAAVERLSDFPPAEAEQPQIERAQTVSDVITLVLISDLEETKLRAAGERLVEELLAIPEVSLVGLMGARDYEISIEVSERALRQYDLSIDEVASAIRRSSVNVSSGELRTPAGDLLLRTNNKRMAGDAFGDIVLRGESDGAILRLEDVATINDTFAEQDMVQELNGRRSLLVSVQKSESEDPLEIAAAVRAFLAGYTPAPGISVDVWDDQTSILEQRLGLLIDNGVLGFTLVFLFLVIMLDLRLATWVAMGVPISFLGALLFFGSFGVNINMISLFALIMVLGIVVDDAVVVGENIITEQEALGQSYQATLRGVAGVFSPVFIGVLTSMAAFAPLLFVTGSFGQILAAIPVVVILVLTISLVEVFLVLPSHLAHGRSWSRGPLKAFQGRVAQFVMTFRDQYFLPAVSWAVRRRYVTLIAALGMLIFAASLMVSGAVRFIFFPQLESVSMRATLTFPVGTPFTETERAARKIIDAAYAINDQRDGAAFKAVNATIGGVSRMGGGPDGGGGVSASSNLASIIVLLEDEPRRTESAQALEREWRQRVGQIVGVESLSFSSSYFDSGADIEFRLAHQDDGQLMAAVEALKLAYADVPGLYDIQDSFNPGKTQFDIELTSAGEAAGLQPADVARQLRNNFYGQEVQRIQRGRDELRVMVRYPRSERESAQNLNDTWIRLADGTQAPLSAVATLRESRSYSSIERVAGLRIVTVSAEADTDLITPTEANNEVMQSILPALRAQFPDLRVEQAGQGREESEDLASLVQSMMIAVLIIFALLASQLRSYTQPLVVLTGIPFGAAGAVIGHFILGYNISFISIFGMVALSGVVVNDALVLLDQYNRNRREGLDVHEAITAASQRRFRAIFLTTVTTALGLTPMLFETSIQAQFLIPMAVSLATGIVFASVIILMLVPALVIIREDFLGALSKIGAQQPDLSGKTTKLAS